MEIQKIVCKVQHAPDTERQQKEFREFSHLKIWSSLSCPGWHNFIYDYNYSTARFVLLKFDPNIHDTATVHKMTAMLKLPKFF